MPWIFRMTLRIALLALPLFLYFYWRTINAIGVRFPSFKMKSRIIIPTVLLWIYLYPIVLIIYHWTGNFGMLFVLSNHSHWLDFLLLYPFWWGFLWVVETVSYFILLDIITLFSRLKFFPRREKWETFQASLKLGLIVFFAFYVGIRAYIDTHHVRSQDTEIEIAGLSEEFKGLKIGLTGDIHADRYTGERKLEMLKNRIKTGRDDLFFCAGDLISRGKRYLPIAYDVMCKPGQRLGNITCMGDHDYWSAPEVIVRETQGCGWIFLRDQHRLIRYKRKKILITGVTHVYSRRISPQAFRALLKRAPDADLKILLVHQPREFLVDIAAEYGYHLFLAGHTHGGQIVNHVLGVPFTPNQFETFFYQGHYVHRGMHVIVTNGIGMTLAPIRYHAPAEVNRIVIH